MAKAWSEEEDELIRENKKPPNRTSGAIRMRRAKLGLTKMRRWTDEDIERLKELKRKNKPNKYIAKLLNRTPEAISSFVSKNPGYFVISEAGEK